jgi:hypothetical protein
MNPPPIPNTDDTATLLKSCAATLSVVAKGMAVLTLVLVLPAELILIWAAKSLWGFNATVYFTLIGLTAFPVLIVLLFAMAFESVTQLPRVIRENIAAVSKLVRTDVPEFTARLKETGEGKRWRVARSAAGIFVTVWRVQDDVLGGAMPVFCAAMMANPLFWIVYAFSLAGCVVTSVVLLIALLINVFV